MLLELRVQMGDTGVVGNVNLDFFPRFNVMDLGQEKQVSHCQSGANTKLAIFID